ncbi:hypothetical protein L293_1291 [Acinetobacter gyllenbergii CIP 110306 = MTCC 11365]|nr:hypothetical protein L293_1291 [Acinetobacter gyllenbergii CIP 110306 = MTCC 11365]
MHQSNHDLSLYKILVQIISNLKQNLNKKMGSFAALYT